VWWGWEFPLASFIRRHTDARLIEYRLATAVNDIPEQRSETTCSRLISTLDLPICLPPASPYAFHFDTFHHEGPFQFCNRRDDGHEQTPIASPVATPSLRKTNSIPKLI
jgi:hypothetical protein